MTIQQLIERLPLQLLTTQLDINGSFHDVYTSDLLSAALAKVTEDHVWITVQVHQNILGVASIKQAAAIILSESLMPDKDLVSKAQEKGIVILLSPYTSFETSGMLYNMLKEEKNGNK
ncbi:MAG: AraC family transcriptional regulator [Caldisericia bacterium]|nr:AraC family transcriptional regulator [Caldisericia bacterium]